MKKLIVTMVALSLTACAGTRVFVSDHQFQDYVTKLQLSQLSVPKAREKLTSLGFICKPSGSDVRCTRSAGHYGGQEQRVLLSPAAGQKSGIKVKTELDNVYI